MTRRGLDFFFRFLCVAKKALHELTTLLWAISWRMLGVTLLQNSSAVSIAVKLNSFWFWTFVATALCSQYTVQSWAKMKAWKREHMWSTQVCKGRGCVLLRAHSRWPCPGAQKQRRVSPDTDSWFLELAPLCQCKCARGLFQEDTPKFAEEIYPLPCPFRRLTFAPLSWVRKTVVLFCRGSMFPHL